MKDEPMGSVEMARRIRALEEWAFGGTAAGQPIPTCPDGTMVGPEGGEAEEVAAALRWYLGTSEHRHPTSRHVGLVRNFLARLERGAVPPDGLRELRAFVVKLTAAYPYHGVLSAVLSEIDRLAGEGS